MNDKFWFQEPEILLTKFMDFFPSKRMSTVERLNSIVRLSVYVTIALILLKNAVWPVYITLVSLALTLFIYNNVKEQFDSADLADNEAIDESTGEKCTMPTTLNPYMNVTMDEISDNPDRAPACNILNPMVSGQVDEKFAEGLYRDVDDIFGRDASINFWSNPSTTIPGDQNKFANWLYGNMPSCKEDSAFCGRTQHYSLRSQRQEFVNPESGVTINPLGN